MRWKVDMEFLFVVDFKNLCMNGRKRTALIINYSTKPTRNRSVQSQKVDNPILCN